MISIIVTFIVVLVASSHALDVLSKLSDTKLNVHIIPHSHDDPGWLKTVDQYYSGTNSSIYTASVQQIFFSVVAELMKDGDRTFSLCEVSFFSRWWNEQDIKMKETVKHLFANGQLSFLNGGWVMHDEASSHFVSMIDQTTLGHRFLLEELGYRPRVGWQIDPFGHSNTHAWLSNEVGFDALFFGRIDYQDREKRFQEKSMEMVWKPSMSDASAQVFTGAFSDGNYGPPSDFCFDTTCPYCRNDPVVTDPLLQTYNLESKIQKFIQGIEKEQSITRGNNLMLKLGSDFAYSNSQSWYYSLDVLIAEVNKRDSRFNLFYSDPTSYMRARAHESTVVWPTKTDDFFPYSDASNTFWTGYFTSRPQFKFMERYASGLLQMIRQWAAQPQVLTSTWMKAARVRMMESIVELTAAVGLVNHHDCITGTEKQHVADDYKRILDRAMQKAESLFGSFPAVSPFVSRLATTTPKSDNTLDLSKLSFSTCRLMNETMCTATQGLQSGDAVVVSLYNPLPRVSDASTEQTTQPLVTVLLTTAAVDQSDVVVLALSDSPADGQAQMLSQVQFVPSELLPVVSAADVYANDPINANQALTTRLVFQPTTPLLSLSSQHFLVMLLPKKKSVTEWKKNPLLDQLRTLVTFQPAQAVLVEVISTGTTSAEMEKKNQNTSNKVPLEASNGIVTLSFDPLTSALRRVTRKTENASIVMDVHGAVGIGYYRAFGGVNASPNYRPIHDKRDAHLQNLQPHPEIVADGISTQPSGTYIFRPASENEPLHAACEISNDAENAEYSCASTANGAGAAGVGQVLQTVVFRGRLVTEVHQRFADWASHTLRLVKQASSVEVEYQLSEIPITADHIGKEIVYRLDTNLHTQVSMPSGASASHKWYTDSNGREFMERIYNYRPTWSLQVYEPIAGNYYPLTAAQYMLDEQRGVQFSWVVDRSLGGASLTSGSMEVMIQRRLLYDDFKGVEEALNETVGGITHYPDWQRIGRGIPVTGKFHWLLSPATTAVATSTVATGMQELREEMDRMFYAPATSSALFLPLQHHQFALSGAGEASMVEKKEAVELTERVLAVFLKDSVTFITDKQSILAQDLPANVQLVTCEHVTVSRSNQLLLVRLAHQFAANEDPAMYSQPVTVDIAAVFAHYNPQRMVELTLSANQNKADQLAGKIQWTTANADAKTGGLTVKEVRLAEDTMTITLQPMQIRTLAIYLPPI